MPFFPPRLTQHALTFEVSLPWCFLRFLKCVATHIGRGRSRIVRIPHQKLRAVGSVEPGDCLSWGQWMFCTECPVPGNMFSQEPLTHVTGATRASSCWEMKLSKISRSRGENPFHLCVQTLLPATVWSVHKRMAPVWEKLRNHDRSITWRTHSVFVCNLVTDRILSVPFLSHSVLS